MNKREIGKKYEDLVCKYLKNNFYEIIERNFFTKQGEIDIVAKNEDYLCFIEVKYRKENALTSGLEAVNMKKQKNIYNVAKYYLYKNKLKEDTACRFDVVSVDGNNITLVKNAFVNRNH